ncbi:MAG TPA: cytochrome c [Candidatus Binatia bacterium]|nr:cytochrome c [Candidatus Binatia bacterium]
MALGQLFAIITVLLLSGLANALQVFAQEDVIDKRKAIMRANNDAVTKSIKKAVEDKDYATIELKAKDIMAGMDAIVTLIPPGSTSEKSRAHPDIWVKTDDFKNKAIATRKVAEALSKAAASKNDEEINIKVKELGDNRNGACGECHKIYRTDFRKGS